MLILGISPLDNDATAALHVNGKLRVIAEERLSRIKMHAGFPKHAVRKLLRQANVTSKDIDLVVYPFMPWQVEGWRILCGFARDLLFTLTNSCTWKQKIRHLRAYNSWQIQAIRNHRKFHHELNKELRYFGLDCPLKRIEHHAAHAWSAYLSSGFKKALALTLDWYGGGLSGSVNRCTEYGIKQLHIFNYPHSLGLFFAQVTSALGFKAARHEGKIVGLAAYGDYKPTYPALSKRLFSKDGDFRYLCGMDPQLARGLAKSFPAEHVAAAYQYVLEEISSKIVSHWLQDTGLRNVVLAGGVAANVKMNQRIAELKEVDGIFIHPNMGDGGTGVGAIFSELFDRGMAEQQEWETCYLGTQFTDTLLKSALIDAGLAPVRLDNITGTIAQLLSNGKIVARFDGAMEYGSRALGNRSILYQATDPGVNHWLNRKLSRTEFMPFAPVTLIDHCHTRFVDMDKLLSSARFMTITCKCTELMRKESPAAVHVDGTARPQILRREDNPSFYDTLKAYYEITGIPTLINTSFNMHEEPIVCTPEDAIRTFLAAELDCLSMGPFLVAAKHESTAVSSTALERKYDLTK